ncbi:MAG: chalcone isomerase family protein [Flavobacteriales bacterium]|nr:chalcone isomerase family protein [Flavobacteriales bacterium]
MKKVIIGLSLIAMSQFSFAQKEISGVTPAKSIEVSGTTLNFNGAGLREKFFLDLYVGALYLTSNTKDANSIIESDQSMAITLDIVSGLINSEKMINAIDDGFDKSTKGNTTPLKAKIEQFKESFKEEIVVGDHYVIAYIKDKGTEVHKNGKKVKSIEGLEFKKALFGIWLCDEPADEDLKEGMLGID